MCWPLSVVMASQGQQRSRCLWCWIGTCKPGCVPELVLLITGDTAAVEGGGGERPAGAWLCGTIGPMAFCSVACIFSWAWRKRLLSAKKNQKYIAQLSRGFFFSVIFISKESGVAILVQLCYLSWGLDFYRRKKSHLLPEKDVSVILWGGGK